jgi:multidrug efflux pump subunit AcrB
MSLLFLLVATRSANHFHNTLLDTLRLEFEQEQLIKRLEEEKLAVDLDTDYRVGAPELLIMPNRQAMSNRGVSVEDVGQV